MALEVTDSTFEEILNSDKPVLVDFWAQWCGPCKMLSPIIDELATEYEGKAVVVKADIDTNGDMVAKFGVRNVPTVLIFKNGEVVAKQVGAAQKKVYVDHLESAM